VDDALPGSLSMNQGGQCGRIGKNTQILALISAVGHLVYQAKKEEQIIIVHLVNED
jgi:hypothetical protein